jgi:sec-independent protein translocase protein TatB
VFGLGFGELVVVLIVAVVVLGPKDLPRYMRKAGQMAARLRRIAFDMREKSGIDEMLRAEGLDRDIAELRRLARGEINGVMAAMRSTTDAIRTDPALTGAVASLAPSLAASSLATSPAAAPPSAVPTTSAPAEPSSTLFTTDREYPPEAVDAYGALPETANVYGGDLPPSDLAADPVYVRGEEPTDAAVSAEAPS